MSESLSAPLSPPPLPPPRTRGTAELRPGRDISREESLIDQCHAHNICQSKLQHKALCQSRGECSTLCMQQAALTRIKNWRLKRCMTVRFSGSTRDCWGLFSPQMSAQNHFKKRRCHPISKLLLPTLARSLNTLRILSWNYKYQSFNAITSLLISNATICTKWTHGHNLQSWLQWF